MLGDTTRHFLTAGPLPQQAHREGLSDHFVMSICPVLNSEQDISICQPPRALGALCTCIQYVYNPYMVRCMPYLMIVSQVVQSSTIVQSSDIGPGADS